MYAVYVYILNFFGLDPINVDNRLGFRRGNINFKYDAVLIDAHVADVFVSIIFLRNADIIEDNVIGVRMIETY